MLGKKSYKLLTFVAYGENRRIPREKVNTGGESEPRKLLVGPPMRD